MPRISALTSLTTADNADELPIVDVSASVTKKITRGDLLKAPLPTNAVTTAAISDASVTFAKLNFTASQPVDANGWTDYGLFYVKRYTHLNNTSIAANASIYVDTAPSAGNPPVAMGATWPTTGGFAIITAPASAATAQAGVVLTPDISYIRGFFAFNAGSSATTFATRAITMVLFKV